MPDGKPISDSNEADGNAHGGIAVEIGFVAVFVDCARDEKIRSLVLRCFDKIFFGRIDRQANLIEFLRQGKIPVGETVFEQRGGEDFFERMVRVKIVRGVV